jgi:hypothetical protein
MFIAYAIKKWQNLYIKRKQYKQPKSSSKLQDYFLIKINLQIISKYEKKF